MLSSSDSEEDCYSNAAKKLKLLRNKYQDDCIESCNLLNESDQVNTNENSAATKCREQQPSVGAGTETDLDRSPHSDECQDDEKLEKLLASCRRQTRSTARGRANGRRGRGRSGKGNSISIVDTEETNTTARGRRLKKRQTVGRVLTCSVPTYSVGNTDEYPDQSEAQTLFGGAAGGDSVIMIEDCDLLEENEELSVKVCWRSSECCSLPIRKHQKLKTMFLHFAHKENVSEDKLLFMYNDRILNVDDTPDSIQYNIAKFIEGGVISQQVTGLVQSKHKDTRAGSPSSVHQILIKFQSQNLKKPLELAVRYDEKLSSAMIKCAEYLEQPLNRLKFEFDGDNVSGSQTAKELDLEGGECIDVKIM
ncbi:uncharacterized protein Rad60 [Battus philenor]|uniref:uncharacterized protein Rad60 n=1 Tax=Battus philenor TaxID=42288 RepID=UPI0035CF7A90